MMYNIEMIEELRKLKELFVGSHINHTLIRHYSKAGIPNDKYFTGMDCLPCMKTENEFFINKEQWEEYIKQANTIYIKYMQK